MAIAPPSVPVDGQLRVWFVPTIAGLTAEPATGPTLAEITAGEDVTCLLVETKVGLAKTQSSIPDRRMCNTTATQIPGSGESTADNITYVYDPQGAPGDAINAAVDELTEQSVGHYVVRRGVPYETEPATGQFVEVQSCRNGVRWDSSNPTEDFSKMTQTRFLSTFVEKVAIAAA